MPIDCTVLVVDDEPHIRKYIGLMVQRLGCSNVVEASNGEEALSQCAQHQPTLVLMDVNMPIMDGIQALELIMSTYPEVLVIMLTSVATREVVERCLELGAVNFIRKDTPAEAITKVIADTYKQFVEHR